VRGATKAITGAGVLLVGAALLFGVFAGAGGAAPTAACVIDPQLNQVTINQGLPYARLVRGKETLVRLYLSLPASLPTCAKSGSNVVGSIKINSAKLNVKNGTTTLNSVPLDARVEAIGAEITNQAPTTRNPATPADSPSDPKWTVPGATIAAGTTQPTGGIAPGYTALFEATIKYQSKGADGVFSAERTKVFTSFTPPGGTSTPISKPVEKQTKAVRLLVVPMGGALPDTARNAVANGMNQLSRLYPVPDGTILNGTASRTAALTSTAGVLRYTINAGVVDLTGLTQTDGKFCGTATNFAAIQRQLIAFRNAWNGVVNGVDAPQEQDSDKVIGVVPAETSVPSGGTGCLEGYAMTNSNESWVRADPNMIGPLFGMEICHTFGCVADSGTYHSIYSNADTPDPDRAYSVPTARWIRDDRTMMKLVVPWTNENTVMEKDHFGYLLCGFGGTNTSGCPAAPTTGTLTGVAATSESFVMYGSVGQTGGSADVTSLKSTGAPLTVADPVSPFKLVQKDGNGQIIRQDGVPVRFNMSAHGHGPETSTSSIGVFNVAYPAATGAVAIELQYDGQSVPGTAKGLNTRPVISNVTVGTTGGFEPPRLQLARSLTSKARPVFVGRPAPARLPASVARMMGDSNCEVTQDRSTSGATESKITFVNESGRTVDLFWLDYEGDRVFYQTIPAGETREQLTWLTHPWVMIDAAGDCIGYTVSSELEQTYVIRKPLEVNEIGDEASDGSCDPVAVGTSADCTLREAIVEANARAGKDTINFDIAGTGVHTISPTSALPTVTDPAVIDGTSQPGYDGFPIIEIEGSGAGTGASGLTITGGSTTVKGLVVNRFHQHGILLRSAGGNKIQGNYIGTNASGTADFGNGREGVRVESPSATIGGTTALARNVISGNNGHGVLLYGSTNSIVQGNYAGTNAAGTAPIGNGVDGIAVDGGGSNTIGGTAAGAGNVASGNANQGIAIFGVDFGTTTGNVVYGNRVGTTYNGSGDVGNGGDGIRVHNGSNTTIGEGPVNNSPTAGTFGARNTIVWNGANGVRIFADAGKTATANHVGRNIIRNNGALGINLVGPADDPNGVTANDVRPPTGEGSHDTDSGPNNLQNFPVITGATIQDGSVRVQWRLSSSGSTPFLVDFYAGADCDPSGFGEGDRWIGWGYLSTNAAGDLVGDTGSGLTAPVAAGDWITMTATGPGGNTSEFAKCVQATGGPPPAEGETPVTVSGTDDTPAQTTTWVFVTCDGRPQPYIAGGKPTFTSGSNYEFRFNFDPDEACGGTTTGFRSLSGGLQSGQVTLTVVTTDGFQPSEPETAAVEAPNTPPAPEISTPSTFSEWDEITLYGTAFDAEEKLTANKLSWEAPGLLATPQPGFSVKLTPPAATGWTPGTYPVTLRATDSGGLTKSVTKNITIRCDADHDGWNCDGQSADLNDNNKYDAYKDCDGDGIMNADDARPCVADSSFTGTATFQPDPLVLPFAGTATMTLRLLNKSVADVLATSVRLKTIEGHNVSNDDNFKATSVAITSTGVLRATFNGPYLSNWLTSNNVRDRRIAVTMGGTSKTTPVWTFEGTGTTYVD